MTKNKLIHLRKNKWAWVAALAIVASAGLAVGTGQVLANQKNRVAQLSPQAKQAVSAANQLSVAFREISDLLVPSVVAIETRAQVASWNGANGIEPSSDPFDGRNPFKGTPFEDMFRDRGLPMQPFQSPPGNDRGMPPSRSGIGSGVIIDSSGIILTNNHVVAGGGQVKVRIHDGREFEATNVWTDPKTDIAVVKIDGAKDLIAAPLGDSDQAQVGEWVLALGQPFGLESSVTAGIISAKHRGIGITDRENFLQTDAAINPGNSGGPLVNLAGEVIGINTAIHSRSGGNNGIGFAVPANMARWVSQQLIEQGKVTRAYLGVGIQPVDQTLAKELGVKPRGGVVVTDVFPDTPAEKTGLESGDVIVQFGDTQVSQPSQLQLVVERSKVGKGVPVKVIRDGKSIELTYNPAERPGTFGGSESSESTSDKSHRMKDFGLEISPLTKDVAEQLGMKDATGVVITSVRDGSSAAEAGLQPGMVITQVNRKPVQNMEEFKAAAGEDGDSVLLLVRSDKGSRFVVVSK